MDQEKEGCSCGRPRWLALEAVCLELWSKEEVGAIDRSG